VYPESGGSRSSTGVEPAATGSGRELKPRPSDVDETTEGTLLVVAAAAGFGTIGIFGEVAARIDLALSTMLPLRFALATVVVVAVATLRDWSLPATRRGLAATLGLGVVYTLMTLSFFVSLRYLTAGLATIVLYTYPAMAVVVSAPALSEPITVRKLVALGLTTAGVALVVWTDAAGVGPLGVGLALGAAACYAVYTVGSRAVVPSASPRGVMLGVLVGTTLSMAAYGVLDGGLALPATRAQWGVVLGLAVVSTVLPHLLFYEGVSRIEAGRVGVVSTVEPVVTVTLGALLLDERVTAVVVAGGALVLGGVVLVQRGRGPTPDADGASEAT
jgi:drug/metabolite transporter (DMT)-like permease